MKRATKNNILAAFLLKKIRKGKQKMKNIEEKILKIIESREETEKQNTESQEEVTDIVE